MYQIKLHKPTNLPTPPLAYPRQRFGLVPRLPECYARNSNPALTSAANALLTTFFNTTSTTTATAHSSIPKEIHAATLAPTTLLDPRLFLLISSPRRLPLSPHPSATSASPNSTVPTAFHAPATGNRSYLAMPTARAHLPTWHARAWVLKPFDPAADRPGTVAALLPPGDLWVALAGERGLERAVEDVVPVLTLDYKGRRRGFGEDLGGWRLGSWEVVFGGCGGRRGRR